MNIWCISKYANTPASGTATRLFRLTKQFINQGHNAVLITSDSNHLGKFSDFEGSYHYELYDNVPVYCLKTRKYKKTASIGRVLSWFSFEFKLFRFNTNNLPKPDVVIVSSLSLFTVLYGYYLKKKYDAFFVFEVRDIWPLTMTEEGNFSKWHPLTLLMSFLEKFGYKNADLITGTMPRMDLHVKNILGYDKPFHCAPLGFDPESYSNTSDTDHSQFSSVFPKDKVIVGYAGSMGITNSLETFMKSIKVLNERNSNIHFMLVGSGDLKASYQEMLSECSNVTFLPRITQDEVKFFLDRCDLLYLATKDSKVWEYGQSMNKVVEYMLAGKPIIASYTGYPSMINEAGCGIFIKSDDPENLASVFEEHVSMEPKKLKELGQKGRGWIYDRRQYSILAKQYLDAIIKLMK